MWNPPLSDLTFNFRHPDPRVNGPSGGGVYQDISPRISLSNDAAYPAGSGRGGGANSDPSIPTNNHIDNNGAPGNIPSFERPRASSRPILARSLPHPKLEKVAPYLTIATLQAYTVLTVVRCLADPVWIVPRSGNEDPVRTAEIGSLEKSFLACAIAFTMLSCLGVTLRILDKFTFLRQIPVVTAYLEACVITVLFSSIVALMLTVDWWRGFPSAGLSATLKALIISSFVMTIVIIIGAAIYSALEDWTFDEAVNFCIVSFATIGYGNLSPKTVAGQSIFFFYGLLGISSLGFFVVSLRNAVIEQFQWRLVDRFSKPAHLTRVQTRMSAKDIPFPIARFEEEQRVKMVVKRKMMVRMGFIWIVMWFGGAGVFCAFEPWTYLESLYFCFVTLTTIGFGDYVPKQPGAIEFWNVYVFVGLAVFAYILSLSSESMASQIHLVDDQDDDNDDDMYGWERNEDPNAPLTTRSGTLGLEGLKWLHHQQNMQRRDSAQSIQVDQEGKPLDNNSTSEMPSMTLDGSQDGDRSLQASIQRSRPGRKSSTGRILMVSAKERKQMLEAEYYATHSLPTTIKFIDTKGMPHQKTVGRASTMADSGSGPNVDSMSGDPAGYTYGTVGYYGTIGRRDLAGLTRSETLPRNQRPSVDMGGANIDNIYGPGDSQPINTVQTQQLQHQPLIKFDSPKGSIRSAGNQPSQRRGQSRPDRLGDQEDDTATGYIPSIMDVFRPAASENAGEGSSTSGARGKKLIVGTSPITRMRSNSWDQMMGDRRRGPSQNDIHSWIAEDAGTLEGPNFNYVSKPSVQGMPDAGPSTDRSRESHGSDSTRVTSPPNGTSDYVHEDAYPIEQSNMARGAILDSALNELRAHPDGIAPDEIPRMPLTDEPEEMGQGDGDYSQDVPRSQTELDATLPSPQPRGLVTVVREPTLPAMDAELLATALPSNPDNLFLGGGEGAGRGPFAEGVTWPDSRAGSEYGQESSPGSRIGSRHGSAGVASPEITPATLFGDDNGHQYTLRPTTSQPLSLFSNHPRSGNNSAMPSPTGSRQSSRPGSVLMTIFDEPVRNLPGSRSVSRSGSIRGSGTGLIEGGGGPLARVSSNPMSQPGSRTGSIVMPPNGSGIGSGSGGGGSGATSPASMRSSESNVGPFGEHRRPADLPHFDDDIDLSHVGATPQQVEEEHRRREDLRRREREIEARLATLGEKGRWVPR
ncbi:Potassium channel [Mortierella hygrophila]|uniref:Potassium channel n=1 Tax=Mortierella hygrophila TaxID=979708 RepID=A0A9P6K8F3_9FUNG|nr:Potassium channel [Mortierella hygrophila]